MSKPGRFTYMSTRNNNFSNRSHKGYIAVHPGTPANPPFSGFVLYIGSTSASPTACPLRGYGRASTQNDRLGERQSF